MELAISDAARLPPAELSPRRAAPLPIPAELALVLGLGAALTALSVLEVRTTRVMVPARRSTPAMLSLDDAELLRGALAAVQADSKNPLIVDVAARFQRVIEDLEQGRLDRVEAFRQLALLEKRLLDGATAERQALEQALKELSQQLDRSDLTQSLGKALGQGKLPDAEQALRKLAERLKSDQGRPSPTELDRLRKALEGASKSSASRAQALEERRQELSRQRDRLLKKKQQGTSSPTDQRHAAELDRQLERLERERRQAGQAQQKLSELDQKLANAAQNLLKELGKSADELAKAAQDLHRLSVVHMRDQQ
jgi:acyl carrier protein phosphodiesterase